MEQLRTCLWFDGNAEEAARFYVSAFRDGKVGDIVRYGAKAAEVSGQPEGSVMVVDFEIEGQRFQGLNGGPQFQFSDAVSFVVSRDTQEEIDELWETLLDGGAEQQCGWITDRFGVPWQVLPSNLAEIMGFDDPEANDRAFAAMLGMKKLDIEELRRASSGMVSR